MSDSKKPPPAPLTDFGTPLFGERLPTPQVVEADTDSAWALFKALQDGDAKGYEDTSPPSESGKITTTPGGLPARRDHPRFADTEPFDKSMLAPMRSGAATAPIATLESVMVEVRRNNRVCPQLLQWQALFGLLLDKARALGKSPPPPPVSSSAWDATPPLSKRLLLRKQVEWAHAGGCLPEVDAYLRRLTEEQWLHMDA